MRYRSLFFFEILTNLGAYQIALVSNEMMQKCG